MKRLSKKSILILILLLFAGFIIGFNFKLWRIVSDKPENQIHSTISDHFWVKQAIFGILTAIMAALLGYIVIRIKNKK